VTEAHACEQLAQAERPGVELTTCRVASQRPNHYTTRHWCSEWIQFASRRTTEWQQRMRIIDMFHYAQKTTVDLHWIGIAYQVISQRCCDIMPKFPQEIMSMTQRYLLVAKRCLKARAAPSTRVPVLETFYFRLPFPLPASFPRHFPFFLQRAFNHEVLCLWHYGNLCWLLSSVNLCSQINVILSSEVISYTTPCPEGRCHYTLPNVNLFPKLFYRWTYQLISSTLIVN